MCHVSCVMSHVSRVTCHMSHVTCQNILFTIYFFFNGKIGRASRWRVCYQRGLPRLFFKYTSCQSCNLNKNQLLVTLAETIKSTYITSGTGSITGAHCSSERLQLNGFFLLMELPRGESKTNRFTLSRSKF